MLNVMEHCVQSVNDGCVIHVIAPSSGETERTNAYGALYGSNDGWLKDTRCVNLPDKVDTVYQPSVVLSSTGCNNRRQDHIRRWVNLFAQLLMGHSSIVAKGSLLS